MPKPRYPLVSLDFLRVYHEECATYSEVIKIGVSIRGNDRMLTFSTVCSSCKQLIRLSVIPEARPYSRV